MNPASRRKKASRDAFTLIELLVVIAIIAILVGLVARTMSYVQERSSRAKAQADIEVISTALESYKLDNGAYPAGDGGDDSSRVLIKELMPKTGKTYFTFPPKMLSNTNSPETGYVRDPFDRPYYYQCDDKSINGPGLFDLWSKGKKNSSDTNLWIKNW